jgi:antitoxin (DNA-binding transcriptional repressor) of toxin-antitoxin stability system
VKVYSVGDLVIDTCLSEAQKESVVITRNGAPVALLVGVEGLDLEQVELCQSSSFWKLIRRRRKQKTLSRRQLEAKIGKD